MRMASFLFKKNVTLWEKWGYIFWTGENCPFFYKAKWCKHKFLSSLPHPAPFPPPPLLRETGLLSWDIPNRVDISLVFSGVWENNFLLHFKITSECHTMCLWDMRQGNPVKNSTTAMQKREGGYLSGVTQGWWLVGCTEPLFIGT